MAGQIFCLPSNDKKELISLIYHWFVDSFLMMMTWIWPFLLFFTLQWHILIGYLVWFWIDRKSPQRGGYRWERYQNWSLHKWYAGYFPITLHKTADLSPNRNYIMGYHPHGVLATTAYANIATNGTGIYEKYPGMVFHLATHKGNIMSPIRRELELLSGMIDSSKEAIRFVVNSMGTGRCCVIVIGGAEESLDAHPGGTLLTLATRRGFVREAIMAGADLVPIYSFGENELYDQVQDPTIRRFQDKFRQTTELPLWLYHGRGFFQSIFGFIPYKIPINTVIGAPIPVKKNENPSPEEIQSLHEVYKRELKALFDKFKVQFGMEESAELQYK